MKIRTEPDGFGFLRVKVEEKEKILEELKRRVPEALAEEVLTAWIDRLQGDATVYQVELLERFPEATKFLESITVTE